MQKTISLPLEKVYHWEVARAEDVYLTQPMGGRQLVDFTWRRAVGEARRMASYLKSLNLPPRSRVGILSKNCAHWIMSDWAIWMAGHISVPLYPTLSAHSVRYILEHSEAEVLFVGKLDDWDTMKEGVPETVRCISYPLSPPNPFPSWNDIIERFPPLPDNTGLKPEDLATIVYTSGSTGKPKGVQLTFQNMAYAAEGGVQALDITAHERMLSYLPLSHVFERFVVEMGSLYKGFRVYFAESLETFVRDLKTARPTLFMGVPRIWTKFQHGVFEKVPQEKLSRLLRIPLFSLFIKRKILKNLGLEHVKFAGSGSAPLPSDVLEWYRGLGLELLEGYGMSENFAYSHMNKPGRARIGYVGEPLPGVETRIGENGEVQIRSPATMPGYYKDEEKTREAFTADGFLRTGDKGEIDEMGRLKLTGRLKEIFKTSKGKYVAPAPIENLLMSNPYIEIVCVSGPDYPQPHALVMLSEEGQRRRDDPAFRAEVERSLKASLEEVNRAVDPHEQLQFIVVIKEPWTMENEFLTPTLKLKRNLVEEAFKPYWPVWYEQKNAIIWQ